MRAMDRYQSHLVWIDLEMTGLDPDQDTIIEIASVVTSYNLELVAPGPTYSISVDDKYLSAMDGWTTKHHTRHYTFLPFRI